MFFFAFSTIIGWYFFGHTNFKALFGEKSLPVYSLIVVVFILVGSTLKVDLVWAMADFFNGLMAIPNLLRCWHSRGWWPPSTAAATSKVSPKRQAPRIRKSGAGRLFGCDENQAADSGVAGSGVAAGAGRAGDETLLHFLADILVAGIGAVVACRRTPG